jgi:hypothetical protein
MAKYRTRSYSRNLNPTLFFLLVIGVVAGFVGGFVFARDRYMEKITTISQMNMEKAVTIDSLNAQVQVLGASTNAE